MASQNTPSILTNRKNYTLRSLAVCYSPLAAYNIPNSDPLAMFTRNLHGGYFVLILPGCIVRQTRRILSFFKKSLHGHFERDNLDRR